MIEINFTKREFTLLQMVIDNSSTELNILMKEFRVVFIDDIKEELEKIIDMILNYFLDYELADNYEPTPLGEELENLNSIFINELQKTNG